MKIYPNIKFKCFIATGSMDNYPTYELLNHYDIIPFISLDARTKAKFDYPPPHILCFDDSEIPICLDNIPYQHWGYSKPKGIRYRCRFTIHDQEPPVECRFSYSSYGKTIYIKPDYDPGMFHPMSRNSKAFKDNFKTKTSVECSSKRIFIDYSIEDDRSRSSMMIFALLTFDVIDIHLGSWIKQLSFSLIDILQEAA